MQDNKYDIPYIYLHLPCTSNAIKNLREFDKNKYITSTDKVSQILSIFAMLYRGWKI